MDDGLSVLEVARDPAAAARLALLAGGEALTFGDLAERTAAACARLSAAGVGPGVRVAILASSTVGTLVAVHALLAMRAIVVPIHPRLTPTEARVLLEDAAPHLVLRDEDLRALSLPVPAPAPAPVPVPVPASDLAIIYTSGTTGRPKGAVLSRRAFIAAAAASATNLGVLEEDRWLLCLPLCHIGGLSIVTRCLLARRTVILAPRFDPEAVLASIARDRATLLSVVATMLAALLEADHRNVLASLRAILVGGGGAPDALLDACARRGVPALTTYGLTEACSQVTAQAPRDPRTREPGSGRALPGVEVRVIADPGIAAQSDPARDPVGLIQIRGPALLRGYWQGPNRSLRVPFDPEGWFEPGDIGALDPAGHLHVLARRTDLIVTGGENVYPAEVEQALEACAGIARALVFGVPDARWGQRVAAAVVLHPDAGGQSAIVALAEEAAARLAPHKRPRLLCVVADLPRTALGKLDRARAVERFASALRPFPRDEARSKL